MNENKFLRQLSKTPSVYWHDSGKLSEVENAIENGALSVTLNPFLTYSALVSDVELWRDAAAEIANNYSGAKKAEELTKLVAGYYAAKLRPQYLTGRAGAGYVCAQTNPGKCGDSAYMIEQGKDYGAVAENICIKLPATQAGFIACEECAALGLNVVMTVGMTVPQALCSGEAIKRGHERAVKNGIKPGFGAAVIMVGRLDDYLRDVAQDNGLSIADSDISLAGIACYKHAIDIFKERGYDAYLMAAAFRSVAQVRELAGSDTMLSIAPKIATLLECEQLTEDISGRPIDGGVIKRLSAVGEFVRAYEPDGMKRGEFITYGAVNRTSAQFVESGWNRMIAL